MSSSMPPHTAIPPPPCRRSSAVDKTVSGMSGGGDMTLTTQQTTSTISPPQTPPTLQQRCSQLHISLMNCTIVELQTLSNQLSLDTTNCNTEVDYINLIEKFSRNSHNMTEADASNDINCKDDNDDNIQSPINLDNQQEQIDAEHINEHNTPDDILPQDNDYRSHLQTQLHTTLQSLSLIELQSLATRLSIDYSNCLHDKVDENFIKSGVIQDQDTGEDIYAEKNENAIIEKLARQHVIQLIEEKALNLPIVLECGNSSNAATDDDGMNDNNDDDTSVISAITTYTSLVNSAEHTRHNSNHLSTANAGNTESGHGEDIKSNHNTLSNNYHEYLQSIRNGGYESYEGNNGSDNNVVRLLSHKEEEADEVQNENEVQGAVDYSEISKEEQVIHHPIAQPRDIGNNTVDQRGVNGVAVQMTSQYPIPPPPPPRRKLNQRVPVDANNGVIPKEQQHFHLPPPPPPPPPRKNEGRNSTESTVENKCSPPKPTIGDSKAASISQTDIYVANEASQKADSEIDNDKQEEFLDAMSELALQINGTLMDIAPVSTEEDSPQSNNSNKQEEFDIDSLIPKNPSHNRSTEECMVKEQYKEYLYPDDESLNDSSYKLHMKQVVKETSTDTNKSNRHRVRSRRSKKSSRKKNSEVLSSVCESTTELDTSSASSASDSDNSEGCESDDDKLTVQTSKLVANLQDYISNI